VKVYQDDQESVEGSRGGFDCTITTAEDLETTKKIKVISSSFLLYILSPFNNLCFIVIYRHIDGCNW
jgi:hypothetical protein